MATRTARLPNWLSALLPALVIAASTGLSSLIPSAGDPMLTR